MEEAVTDTIIKGATQRIEESQQANANAAQQQIESTTMGAVNYADEGNTANEAYGGVVNINSFVRENQQKASTLANTEGESSAGLNQNKNSAQFGSLNSKQANREE